MAIRQIIEIDEEKCDGCGLCILNCAEGAMKIIDGKAKLISDNLCDGIGACLGHCPQDALKIIEREADEFDEEAVEDHLANLKKEANSTTPCQGSHNGKLGHGGRCPGSKSMIINRDDNDDEGTLISSGDIEIKIKSQLTQWPVQLKIVAEDAPYLSGRGLLIAADCVPVAYPNFHLDLLKGNSVVIGCPKFDDIAFYTEKLTNMIKNNDIKEVTVAHMEVPCCTGIVIAAETAIKNSGKDIRLNKVRIARSGQREDH
ncbi:4Fe-4S ferredoxin iron-sulfur binding domain-containing protein [Gottschalkia acidurici 9a]|uniref:4Fe-4S ferredoxin iron-sulfur binding domain-containing protein n=1 Tax=Gottschalkia acidurici (strain ATCC 7906 / DSM 604 / BCRC 14475 / CIP 104303 / KCTC 5404 / NCIMB 10678 / 9a) TaxID=1128398 RepID=K0B1R0_GOTA9|nr:4Fe-4S dicluster domain-containing protein [Gottschalkia acidurici]AFS79394.1 4Fe-4S ferredoxin iron-sulfur binding domain-containing protein [Gottschalkia acidurici 9a]